MDSVGMPVAGAANVLLDAASGHRWEALNEHVFVGRAIDALRRELGPAFDEFVVIVFSPSRPDVRPASADLRHPRKILIFISDESGSVPSHLAVDYLLIFKAYLPHDLPGTNIAAFSVGYVGDPAPAEPVPASERPIDLFFSGNLNANRFALYQACHPWLRRVPPLPHAAIRLVLATPLRRLIQRDFSQGGPRRTHIRFTDGFMAGLAPAAYGDMLAASRIVLCPRGYASAETFRHVEALRAGAVVVTTAMPDTVLYRGAPFVCVDNWRDGVRHARELAAHPGELMARQAAGIAWYDQKLSPRAMGRAMAAAIAGLSAPRGVR